MSLVSHQMQQQQQNKREGEDLVTSLPLDLPLSGGFQTSITTWLDI